jgi:Kef-type K+ transport system membrane component KefB
MDFSQLSLLVVVSAVFGFIAKIFRQPLLVGYLFAGLILSASGIIDDHSSLENLGKIGVALLLFLLGLEMNLKEVATIGKHASIAGFFEMALTAIFGFGLCILIGIPFVPALYISTALTFSSTIIMVKLLSEKKDLSSLYGKISVGSLLFQDLVAIFILIFLAGLGQSGASLYDYIFVFVKLIILLATLLILSKKVIPIFFERFVAGSTELTFIVSVAWALGVASFVAGPVGFSLEIGGFLAGLTLSGLPEHLQIAARNRSLRDFFLTIFFVYLGTQLVIEGSIISLLLPTLLFSAVVLIINPINVLIVMGFMGYKKRTSFLSALTVSQTSEFSLILMTVGATLGHVRQSDVAVVVLVTAITMTISTYMIIGGDKLYKRLSGYLSIFERKRIKEKVYVTPTHLNDHIVLVGCDRTGSTLVRYFQKKGYDFLVVDFNPSVYSRLTADNIDIIFGDISDPEIFTAAGIEGSRVVISTISNLPDNLTLLENINKLTKKPISIFTASTRKEAVRLYEAGASYVTVPDIVAGDHIRHLFRTYGVTSNKLVKMGKKHFERLIYT